MTSPDRTNDQRGSTVTTLAAQDHDDLAAAAALVRGVIDRHVADIKLAAMAAFDSALLDLRLGERYLAPLATVEPPPIGGA